MRKSVAATALILACSASAGLAAQPENGQEEMELETEVKDLSLFVGLRLWANKFDIPAFRLVVDPNTGNVEGSANTYVSDFEVAVMPTVGLRWRDFLISATYFAPTKYGTSDLPGTSVRRTELDLTVGYYVLPSLLVSVGYKKANVDDLPGYLGEGFDAEIDGFLVGLTGSAPLSDSFSLYGSFAYGIGKQDLDAGSFGKVSNIDAAYQIAEIGIAYRFPFEGRFVRSASVSLGFRIQTLESEDLKFPIFAPGPLTTPIAFREQDGRSTTSGPVLSLVATF